MSCPDNVVLTLLYACMMYIVLSDAIQINEDINGGQSALENSRQGPLRYSETRVTLGPLAKVHFRVR